VALSSRPFTPPRKVRSRTRRDAWPTTCAWRPSNALHMYRTRARQGTASTRWVSGTWSARMGPKCAGKTTGTIHSMATGTRKQTMRCPPVAVSRAVHLLANRSAQTAGDSGATAVMASGMLCSMTAACSLSTAAKSGSPLTRRHSVRCSWTSTTSRTSCAGIAALRLATVPWEGALTPTLGAPGAKVFRAKTVASVTTALIYPPRGVTLAHVSLDSRAATVRTLKTGMDTAATPS